MMKRRAFLGGTLSAVTLGSYGAQSEKALAQNAAAQTPSVPLVWPVVRKPDPDIPSFAGHTDTVPDIVGRIGTTPSLVIFTEGNHLMALLSEEIVGAFPSWAKTQAQFANLNLSNVVVVTLPQPIVVQIDQDLSDLVPGFLGRKREDARALRSAVERGDADTRADPRPEGYSLQHAASTREVDEHHTRCSSSLTAPGRPSRSPSRSRR